MSPASRREQWRITSLGPLPAASSLPVPPRGGGSPPMGVIDRCLSLMAGIEWLPGDCSVCLPDAVCGKAARERT